MNISAENKNKYVAFALTVGLHVLLFLLFIFIVFVTPIPPFEVKPVPEITLDLGMEGFGNADAGGSGQKDKDIATSEKVRTNRVATNNESATITDETETAVSVKSNPKNH